MFRVLLSLLLLSACGESFSRDDGGMDGSTGSCRGAAPTDCWSYRFEEFCCDPIAATCEEGEWVCPQLPDRWSCEGSCRGGGDCGGITPDFTCHEDLGDGCCGAESPPLCAPPVWSCTTGQIRRSMCRAFAPECGSGAPCDGRSELECLNTEGCVPVYDDDCCPACEPGGCADCVDLEFERCEVRDVACDDPSSCGRPAEWSCDDVVPDCSRAFPMGEGPHCDVPGCVRAVEGGCTDPDCPQTCVPFTAASCMALCPALPPPCPSGFFPEGDGGCFTFRCIDAELCAPPEG